MFDGGGIGVGVSVTFTGCAGGSISADLTSVSTVRRIFTQQIIRIFYFSWLTIDTTSSISTRKTRVVTGITGFSTCIFKISCTRATVYTTEYPRATFMFIFTSITSITRTGIRACITPRRATSSRGTQRSRSKLFKSSRTSITRTKI